MIVSIAWLKDMIEGGLPKALELKELLTKSAFEVEDVQEMDNDTVLDVDVLPNRAHDCLSHRGIAREVAMVTGKSFVEHEPALPELKKGSKQLSVSIEDDRCVRYIGTRIEDVSVVESPKWLRDRLEVIGQRPINTIVDITNYVMNDLGQPMHAFDADKVSGSHIIVRQAKEGETMTTLDGQEVECTPEMTVIADEEKILALAGVKGGKAAEVDEDTKNIILESANFNGTSTRKTSQYVGIRTDSSKRYENEISSELAKIATNRALELISEEASGIHTVYTEPVDVYPRPEKDYFLELHSKTVKRILGDNSLTNENIEEQLEKMTFVYSRLTEGEWSVKIPPERLDLRIQEDLVEEIARVRGYDKIASEVVGDIEGFAAKVNPQYYLKEKLRFLLVSKGYSEIYTYTFRKKGDISVARPVAKDKGYLRKDLKQNFEEAMKRNLYNADLIGVDDVRMFEIGTVYSGKGDEVTERVVLGIGRHITNDYTGDDRKKMKSDPEVVLKNLAVTFKGELGYDFTKHIKRLNEMGGFVEIDISALLSTVEGVDSYGDLMDSDTTDIQVGSLSTYPFVVRDIAVFVNDKDEQQKLEEILMSVGDDLAARKPRLFDVYEPKGGGKVSYAYRLVFQAQDRTLTDSEVNTFMDEVYAEIAKKKGWEVR